MSVHKTKLKNHRRRNRDLMEGKKGLVFCLNKYCQARNSPNSAVCWRCGEAMPEIPEALEVSK